VTSVDMACNFRSGINFDERLKTHFFSLYFSLYYFHFFFIINYNVHILIRNVTLENIPEKYSITNGKVIMCEIPRECMMHRNEKFGRYQ